MAKLTISRIFEGEVMGLVERLRELAEIHDCSGEGDNGALAATLRQAATALTEFRGIAQDLCDYNAKYMDEMARKERVHIHTDSIDMESPFVRRFREALLRM